MSIAAKIKFVLGLIVFVMIDGPLFNSRAMFFPNY